MISYHSILRANERTRYNGKTAERFIENGLERGKTALDFGQAERRFLENRSTNDCMAKAYNGYCFIVSDEGLCVTLYPLPEWFGKKRHYDGKKLIRKPKRYAVVWPLYA